jgi:uncharacterized damage-inducible protein DinB
MTETAGENAPLSTFYESWQAYQDRIKRAVAPLTAEQLALRSAPNLRSVGEIATHIVSCRAGWFTYCLGEDGGPEVQACARWGEPGAPPRTAEELAQGLDRTWAFMAERLARWSPADMHQTFQDEGEDGKVYEVSRAWVIWHLIEHDVHHGGELSLTLGMQGIEADFPG